MPFQPGNKAGAKARKFYDAMMRAAAADDYKALRHIADKVLELALEGDMPAITMVRDTLDGKPHQSMTLSGDPDAPLTIASAETLRSQIRGENP